MVSHPAGDLARSPLEVPTVPKAYWINLVHGYQEALRVLGDGADRDLRIIEALEGDPHPS